jgi:hypothetical protein
MYVEVMQGRTSDPAAVRAALDRWAQELAPGATGWLGTTAGVTEDGRVVSVIRFESEEVATRAADRPEHRQWWTEAEQSLEAVTTVRSSTDVTVDLQGDPDRAGFVQVMQGRTNDPVRAAELMAQDPDVWAEFRPDVLGSVTIGHEDGGYTMVLYFTSEAEAREGELKEVPLQLRPAMEEMDKLAVGETEFFDLREPWLRSPA